MTEFVWTGDAAVEEGSVERPFEVDRDGQMVPGIFWRPERMEGQQPLVLMGHGGSGHKRHERMLMLGQKFSRDFGWCAASIDGPTHGDRGPVTTSDQPEYRAMWQREGVVDGMIEDWKTTLDALSELDEVEAARVGYWGQSMGTMFGLPFVANEPRVSVAVLGKAGMTGPSVARSGIDRAFAEHAPRVTIPVMFVVQWDDERFDRAGQLDLFDRIGSEDKRLLAYPGPHGGNAPEAFDIVPKFLERYLTV